MSSWTNNNLAHADTYLTLRVLEQTRRKFKNAGNLKISGLAFYDPTSSNDVKRTRARTLALELSNVFRTFFQAKFEDGFTKTKSVDTLASVLVDGEKTVQQLADTADTCYVFKGEPSVA